MKKKIGISRVITLSTLFVALALAMYLNWRFTDSQFRGLIASEVSTVATTETVDETQEMQDDEQYEEIAKNYGDAEFVSKISTDLSKNEFFESARISRSEARDAAIDLANQALMQPEITKEERELLANNLSEISKNTALEGNIESIVVAKGFYDCVTFINDDTAKVIVAMSEGELDETEVSKIVEVIVSETEIKPSNISVVEVK